ncbi:MAG: hypothetical protein KDK62_05835 [Chlamydiia bacterium]|nr:hypothetical protein [Chlamydiia bacterium]
MYPKTVILRHRRENLKKCSLRGLESREDFQFISYPLTTLPDLTGYIHFTLDAPPLTAADSDKGFFFVDATWRLAGQMEKFVESQKIPLIPRSLPAHYRTAYPRKQTGCLDPDRGLATVEAVYLAYLLSERDTDGLLDFYYWKEAFLSSLT